ncbi:MAG: hypothetical protein LBK65_07675 [Tannerellaceae bacterium]|jgi:hypothetical protein|nr:hypothetical protein [Tannerellaceae bacterium]
MKTFKNMFLFIVIALGLSCFQAMGQVTVGSDIAPLSGVLLDIKSQAADPSTNATTTGTAGGGLGLPRVVLTSETTLAPFLPSATAAEMKARAGLMVYNVSTTSPFKPGVYVWNGTKWTTTGEGIRYFYMPSCNIEVASTGTKTFNLYNEYVRQFTRSGNGTFITSNSSINYVPSPELTRLYAANELDYVITYYDTSVFTGVSINAAGLMSYTVNTTNTTSATYFNIVFIVK